MKHIKVRARLLPGMDSVSLQIIEQSHRKSLFGAKVWASYTEPPSYVGSRSFTASNGIQLYSESNLEWDYSDSILYVRGGAKPMDNISITLSLSEWSRIKQAILEYNEWGKTQ